MEVLRNTGFTTCPGKHNWWYFDLTAIRNEWPLRDHVFKFIYVWIGEAPLLWNVYILEAWELELDSTQNLNYMFFSTAWCDGHGDLDHVNPRHWALGYPKSTMYPWLDPKFGKALQLETLMMAQNCFQVPLEQLDSSLHKLPKRLIFTIILHWFPVGKRTWSA